MEKHFKLGSFSFVTCRGVKIINHLYIYIYIFTYNKWMVFDPHLVVGAFKVRMVSSGQLFELDVPENIPGQLVCRWVVLFSYRKYLLPPPTGDESMDNLPYGRVVRFSNAFHCRMIVKRIHECMLLHGM